MDDFEGFGLKLSKYASYLYLYTLKSLHNSTFSIQLPYIAGHSLSRCWSKVGLKPWCLNTVIVYFQIISFQRALFIQKPLDLHSLIHDCYSFLKNTSYCPSKQFNCYWEIPPFLIEKISLKVPSTTNNIIEEKRLIAW